jgi:hypothetical protein
MEFYAPVFDEEREKSLILLSTSHIRFTLIPDRSPDGIRDHRGDHAIVERRRHRRIDVHGKMRAREKELARRAALVQDVAAKFGDGKIPPLTCE